VDGHESERMPRSEACQAILRAVIWLQSVVQLVGLAVVVTAIGILAGWRWAVLATGIALITVGIALEIGGRDRAR
jgi:hypothetical protein